MSQYKYAEIGDTVYFWFAANTTAGAAGDGATPLFDVRLAGAAAGAAPTASGTPTLLTHADYTDGLHEIAVDTTGYAAGEYAVFCTLTISSVNPGGFVGSVKVRTAGTAALATNTVEWRGTAVSDPTVEGVPNVNVKTVNDVATTSVTTIGAVIGTATAGALETTAQSILTDTTEIGVAGAGLTAINLPDQTINITGNLSGSVGSVTGLSVAAILTTAITEAYRANGAAPTLAQFICEVLAHLGEADVTGTTKTIKKLDHSTTAETFTLDSSTTPTLITRST